MGRDTTGVRGMNVSRGDNAVIAMDVARDDQELLVVTENGYGKRTALSDYPRKGRGTMGVKTISLTEAKGALAGALVVREHEELVFISTGGMVQRTSVRGINRYGRASQGVRVMNLKDDEVVSAVALVAEGNGGVENGDLETAVDGANGAAPPVAELAPEPIDDDLEPTEDATEEPAEDDDTADE
jgi:DNA gyrase subunit A